MTPAAGNNNKSEVSGSKPDKVWSEQFEVVLADEHARINAWRGEGRQGVTPLGDGNSKIYDTSGLALSGGGIRSAAFCLGALQALDGTIKISSIDYLSTVSGGGYIGASLTAGMHKTGGKFPFSTDGSDKSDNHAVGHIRNYANYLLPRGALDAVASASIILRGLAVNLVMIIALILVCAAATRLMNPNQEALLKPDILGFESFPFSTQVAALGEFSITKVLTLVGIVLAMIWGVRRSLQEARRERRNIVPQVRPEFADQRINAIDASHLIAQFWIVLIALSLFLEAQPYAIRWLYDHNYALALPVVADQAPVSFAGAKATAISAIQGSNSLDYILGPFAAFATSLTKYLAPLSAFLALFGAKFTDVVKTQGAASGWTSRLQLLASKLALWLIALMLPLTIWVVYLHVTIWADVGFIFRPQWLHGAITAACGAPDVSAMHQQEQELLVSYASNQKSFLGQSAWDTVWPMYYKLACAEPYLIALLYGGAGALLFSVAFFFLRPNSNSLHRLYRDRLSKTFLFDPTQIMTKPIRERNPNDPQKLDTLQFADLSPTSGPLHIFNAALNIQNSKFVGKRGRQADFFFFSPAWSGSLGTGFIRTPRLVAADKCLDIGTVMAISGAAASSNMGTRTVRGLAPTLALLNIRLGYWMQNPFALAHPNSARRGRAMIKLYLPAEMFGLIDDTSPYVYLTDGGHIENLGLYELLRRRCKKIIVVDAEADPNLDFNSFVDLQRYARIDLGVRIRLPWAPLRAAAADIGAAKKEAAEPRTKAPEGAHVCVGEIDYGGDEKGVLIYLKACLTGDENDYILGYKARNPSFPHETTGDQFFSEEQFEVYRALGNHAMRKTLAGEAHVEGMTLLPGYAPEPDSTPDDLIAARKAAFAQLFA